MNSQGGWCSPTSCVEGPACGLGLPGGNCLESARSEQSSGRHRAGMDPVLPSCVSPASENRGMRAPPTTIFFSLVRSNFHLQNPAVGPAPFP